jgi:hypothetical protein
MRRLAILALALPFLAAPAAQAAPPWSPAQNVSAAHLFVDAPALGFAADGTGLATWLAGDRSGTTTTGEVDGAALAPGATAFGTQRTISRGPQPSVVSPPVHYASSRTLVATRRPASGGRTRLAAVFGRADGSFGAPRTLAVRENLRDPQVAADAAGDAAVVWFEDRGVTDDRVYISFRPHTTGFGPPILLATDRVRSVSVAVSPRGDVLVAWEARGTIKTRLKPAASPLFRPTDTLTSRPTDFAALRTAMTANGRAFVAWGAQLLTEGGDRGPVHYQVAVRPAGAKRFRAAQLLETQSNAQTQGGLDLATDAGNRATVAWTGFDGEHYVVRASTTDASARFSVFQNVSPAGTDALEGALASAPDGRRLVAWIGAPDDAGSGTLNAAVAPASGPFGPPESVSAGPQARVPSAAFDPYANRWGLAWSNRPAGSAGPLANIQTFLQISLRPG